jgi:Ricin-type beta-trefoil lectin domain
MLMRKRTSRFFRGLLPAVAALGLLATAAPAHASTVIEVKQKYSGKCMDVRDGNTNVGAYVQQYDCNGTPAQQWTLNLVPGTSDTYYFQNADGLCLEDRSSFMFNGAPVDQAQCNPYAAQFQWKLRGPYIYYAFPGAWYQLQNVLNPRCLDSEFSTANSALLLLNDCGTPTPGGGGWWNQQFEFTTP